MVSKKAPLNTTASEIIERLITGAGVKNATALAGILGVTPQAISSAKKKGKIPRSWVLFVAKKYSIPVDVLLHGSKYARSQTRELEFRIETEGGERLHEMKRFWNGGSGDDEAALATPIPAHVTEEIFFLSRRLVEAQDEIRSLTEIKHKLEMTIQKLRFEKEQLDKENQKLKEQIKLLMAEGNSGGYRNTVHGER